MIYLNTESDGKPTDFIVTITRTYKVHTCDENPYDAIREFNGDGEFDDATPESEDLSIEKLEAV